MVAWDRHDRIIVGALSSRQTRWLRAHLTDYLQRLALAIDGNEPDPVVATVVRTRRRQVGRRSDLRSVLVDSHSAVTASLGLLPDDSGVIELVDDAARRHWVWALQELRTVVRARRHAEFDGDAEPKVTLWLGRVADHVARLGELPIGIENGPISQA